VRPTTDFGTRSSSLQVHRPALQAGQKLDAYDPDTDDLDKAFKTEGSEACSGRGNLSPDARDVGLPL
jgi:hypothetical protein